MMTTARIPARETRHRFGLQCTRMSGRTRQGGFTGMRWMAAVLSLAVLGLPGPAGAQAQPPGAPPPASAPGAPGEPAAPVVAGRALTLPEVIDIAMRTQPTIQSRLYDYAAARFRVDQAFAPLLPQLSASASLARSRVSASSFTTAVSGAAIDTNRSTTSARLSLSQLLFDFGKNLAATDVAKRLAEVAKEDIEVQRDLITLAVKEAYFNLLFGKRLVGVNEQALQRAELNLRSARGFFEVGTRPKFDVTRAEVDVANARVELIRARNAERLARVALNTGMGIAVDSPTEVEDILAYQPFAVDADKLLQEARRGRPEYRQARLRVEAAEAAVRREFRNFFPDLTGNASIGGSAVERNEPSLDLNETWEVGVSLNWSIFDGGNKFARYREARANLESAQSNVRATDLDIWQEVEQANLNVRETEERIQAAAKAVESAQESFRLAQGRFDAGVGTIIELTDAQLALTQAQSTEAQALADYRIAIARLERAIGRR
jgi:outer membrane protein TolC